MKIIKYEKKSNDKYKIYLENDQTINVYEDVILKNNLLYKKEIDDSLLEKISIDNDKEDMYNKCIKYISVRIRSRYEIIEYLRRKETDNIEVENILERLEKNDLIDDDKFAKAFIHDKLMFSTMGPYRIQEELKKHKINSSIISKYINDIDEEIIDNKINKQITKLMKSNRKKQNLRNKIYTNLLSLGYSNEMIIRNINNYEI
ncbi:MAG: RecX family transcriptional regulator [Bacilli bacterium]|nr:RecX family transcriptional regulator [Bacilli bacterium]